jgi:histidine triad (HIT) family protein
MTPMNECVFCKIVAGTESARMFARVADAVAFHPLNPVTLGHLLVVPKRHVATFKDDPYTTGQTAAWAAEIAKMYDDCNLITSAGPNATQTVQHLHFHIVPRSPNDGLHLPWTNQAKDS